NFALGHVTLGGNKNFDRALFGTTHIDRWSRTGLIRNAKILRIMDQSLHAQDSRTVDDRNVVQPAPCPATMNAIAKRLLEAPQRAQPAKFVSLFERMPDRWTPIVGTQLDGELARITLGHACFNVDVISTENSGVTRQHGKLHSGSRRD